MGREQAHQGSQRWKREPNVSDKWWYVILLNGLIYIIAALGGAGLAILGFSITALQVFKVVLLGIIILGPIAVHFDRQYVRAVSSWTPTPFYYLVFFGPLGSLISFIYLYHRHNHVGTP